MTERASLIEGNIAVLVEGLGLISQLDSEVYASCRSPLQKGGIGSHLRHCLEFYQVFLGSYLSRRVDYDLRARNPILESDLQAALVYGRELIGQLPGIAEKPLDTLQVRHDGSGWCVSSIERELTFLLSHTVHHFSIIAIALRLRGIEPGGVFGVAPSTLAHRKGAA